jgi:thiamine-phosphate pyrophosphorylase
MVGIDHIVGVACGTRHDAMIAGEKDADYVAFGTVDGDGDTEVALQLIEWWSAMMTVPCVAATDASAETCRRSIVAGADFLAVGNAVWHHAVGPGTAVGEIARAIAEAPRG